MDWGQGCAPLLPYQPLNTDKILCFIISFTARIFSCIDFSLNIQPNPGLPSSHHRKVACSFRDLSLLQVFRISLTSLHQLKNDGNVLMVFVFFIFVDTHYVIHIWRLHAQTAASRLQELALSLSLKCLSFDFIGTSIDESSDEFGTLQVQASFWGMNIFRQEY